jgi:hypothetical protein
MTPGRKAYWIIGGGAFGSRAAETLRGRFPAAEIRIVERDPARCRALRAKGYRSLCMDGIAYLAGELTRPDIRAWIVPAAPVHVALEWVRAMISGAFEVRRLPVPEAVAVRLPNAMRGVQGELYASNADFLCPPDCLEAGRRCPATGRPRPRAMHAAIRGLSPPPDVKIMVLRSYQLAPSVGGLRPRELFAALTEMSAAKGLILFATACRCHAVIHAIQLNSKP